MRDNRDRHDARRYIIEHRHIPAFRRSVPAERRRDLWENRQSSFDRRSPVEERLRKRRLDDDDGST